MTITFSEEEYHRLMVMAYLGEWMVNAIRKDSDPSYEDAASKVYSYARGTPLEAMVVFNGEAEDWEPAERFEGDAHAIIDQYDDKTFWEELTARLTERDLIAAHGERAVSGMRPGQKIRAARSIAQAYTKEFEDHGLDRLKVSPPRR